MIQTDGLMKCPKTGGDFAYYKEVGNGVYLYNSLSSGYWTNSLMTEGSEFYEEQMEILPELYKDCRWEDPKTGLVWFPQTINIPNLGLVFLSGRNKEEIAWGAVRAIPVKEEEKKKFPIKGKQGEFYKFKPDMENIIYFPHENGFISALNYIDALKTS